MSKAPVLYAAIAALVLAAIIILFALPAPEPVRSKQPDMVMNTKPSSSGLTPSAGGGSPAKPNTMQESIGGAVSDMATAMSEEKRKQLEQMNEAMTTYSAESLPILTPYLASPDPEIRTAAVEAVVQLAAPEGAEVLRTAAKTAKNPEEQAQMLKGAEHLELPRLPVEELRKMIDEGTIKLQNGPPPSE